MSFIDDDLGFALSDFDAVTVKVAGLTVTGHLEETDAIEMDTSGDPVQRRLTVLRLERLACEDAFGALRIVRGDTAVVDGVSYSVTEILIGDPNAVVAGGRDGRELIVRVRKV